MNGRSKLSLVLASMLLATHIGTTVSAMAAVDASALHTISSFVERNDGRALYDFLVAHPQLLEGDGMLATLLRQYLEDVQSGNLAAFNIPEVLKTIVSDAAVPTGSFVASIY